MLSVNAVYLYTLFVLISTSANIKIYDILVSYSDMGVLVVKKSILKIRAFSIAEAMVVLLIASIALAASAPIISRQMKSSSTSSPEFLKKVIKEELKQEILVELENKITSSDNQLKQEIINNLNDKISNSKTEVKNEIQREMKDKLVPSKTVAFFNSTSCPSGWTRVNSSWNGRYIKISGNYNVCKFAENGSGGCDSNGIAKSNISYSTGTMFGDAIREITGRLSQGASTDGRSQLFAEPVYSSSGALWVETKRAQTGADSGVWLNNMTSAIRFQASRVVPVGNEVRPKTIVLLACMKS